MKQIILTFCLLFAGLSLFAQSIKDTSLLLPMFRINYAYQIPGGDLAERFGHNTGVGFSIMLKTRSNFLVGYQFDGLFGNNVREDGVLDSIKTSNGEIINQLGKYADILINERGFYTGPQVGYLFSFDKPNPNSGIYFLLGPGFIQHKINIQNKNEDSPQILGEYQKGYDRLTNGFALKESLGFTYFDNKSIVNFYVGIEFYQAFTENRRSFDYDLMRREEGKRLDLLIGFKLGWIFTVQERIADSYYYY